MVKRLSTSDCASDGEVLKPLIDHCKAGRLFDVQEWIASKKPINPPLQSSKRQKLKSPLQHSIERGFHSLVQVLLEAGASQEPNGSLCPIYLALEMRRLDLIELLIEHGFHPPDVDMREVFSTWDPVIMRFFIDRGADLHRDNPFAYAFCNRIRTVLRVFKDQQAQDPRFMEQANIALRYHCKRGNLKWVSLLLWAGADPLKRGSEDPDTNLDDTEETWGLSGLALAALYKNWEIFELKPVRSKFGSPEFVSILDCLTSNEGLRVLKQVLERGLNPNDQENGGCSTISSCVSRMSWDIGRYEPLYGRPPSSKLDTSYAREGTLGIHLLAKYGAKWVPKDKQEIQSARRSLLKLIPDYTIEFVWIMGNYQACSKEHIEILLSTPSIKSHLSGFRDRLDKILSKWASP